MEINVNRKIIILATALAALISGFVVALWPNQTLTSSSASTGLSTRAMTPSASATQGNLTDPEKATSAFVDAFYAVDFANYQDWLSGLQAVSTHEGYAILQKSIAPVVWPEIERAQTVTPAEEVTSNDIGLVLEGHSPIGGTWQIRKVQVHISSKHLWPTMSTGDFTALVMLTQQDGEWRFVSFMTPEQIEQIEKGEK